MSKGPKYPQSTTSRSVLWCFALQHKVHEDFSVLCFALQTLELLGCSADLSTLPSNLAWIEPQILTFLIFFSCFNLTKISHQKLMYQPSKSYKFNQKSARTHPKHVKFIDTVQLVNSHYAPILKAVVMSATFDLLHH